MEILLYQSVGLTLCFFTLTNLLMHSSFADRDMVMRYYWGLGIGHAYSHATPMTLTNIDSGFHSAPQPPSSNDVEHVAKEFDDLEHDAELLSEIDFEPPSPVGSESETDSDSVLVDDYADLDGWDDLDQGALDGYEF